MPRTSTPMIRANFFLTERQHKLITAVAKKRGTTFSEALRILLDKALTGQRVPGGRK